MALFGGGLLSQQQPGLLNSTQMPRVPWSQNPMITMAGLSLLGGRSLNEGLQNVAQTAPAGMLAKSNQQQFMLAQQEKAAKKAEDDARRARMNEVLKAWPGLSNEQRMLFQDQPELFGQYAVSTMGPKEGWVSLTDPAQRAAAGIPEGDNRPAQMNSATGEIKFPGGSGTTVNNTINGEGGADNKLRGKLSEAEGTRWSQIQQVGLEASSRSQDFEVMGELLKIAPQGPITGRLAEMFPGFSSAGDALNALVRRIAPTMRAPGSGATSDIEYDGMVKSIPSLSKDPLGNQIILETMKAKQQLDMERADIVTAYQNEEISAAEARAKLGELNRKSILSPKARALINSAAGVAPDGDLSNVPPGVDAEDWKYMTPEQRALFE